jgi:hypothetical protein
MHLCNETFSEFTWKSFRTWCLPQIFARWPPTLYRQVPYPDFHDCITDAAVDLLTTYSNLKSSASTGRMCNFQIIQSLDFPCGCILKNDTYHSSQ